MIDGWVLDELGIKLSQGFSSSHLFYGRWDNYIRHHSITHYYYIDCDYSCACMIDHTEASWMNAINAIIAILLCILL